MKIDYDKYAGHTSGDWEAYLDGLFYYVKGKNKDLVRILTCNEDRVNANLIADAPKLLVACKERDALIEEMVKVLNDEAYAIANMSLHHPHLANLDRLDKIQILIAKCARKHDEN